mmetsp:Transcript_67140/g.218577  ORF Transcript_67140/g.218577 Transcript_67140/m.218577 type:complete len:330 (-) Transcript_67140:45-1034(-)
MVPTSCTEVPLRSFGTRAFMRHCSRCWTQSGCAVFSCRHSVVGSSTTICLWTCLPMSQVQHPGGGYWYAFNTVSVFWMLEGYLSVTNDRELLYDMPINGESVSELLERLATNWTDPRWSSTSPEHKWLADYGGTADNFLECIPTYVHTPAALQAQNVHMLRSVARLHKISAICRRPRRRLLRHGLSEWLLGYTGGFSAWPALSAQSLALLADESEGLSAAVVFLRDTAAATANGPYGQMQWVRPGDQPPFKDLLPSGTRFLANCGCAFADVMLRRLFGYLPTLGFEEPTLWRPGLSRAELAGRLEGVRLPNGSFADICADVAGVRFCRP